MQKRTRFRFIVKSALHLREPVDKVIPIRRRKRCGTYEVQTLVGTPLVVKLSNVKSGLARNTNIAWLWKAIVATGFILFVVTISSTAVISERDLWHTKLPNSRTNWPYQIMNGFQTFSVQIRLLHLWTQSFHATN